MTLRDKPTLGQIYAMVMIGTGLVAFGIVLMLLLNKAEQTDSSADFSAVPMEVDYPAPDLRLQDLDGNTFSLLDYRGKVVLVNLWATWCPPCREEMPTLNAFYESYRRMGFELIAINQEEPHDVVEAFVVEFGLSFPVWLDPDYLAQRNFHTMNLPSSYVIDRDGRVRLMWIGGISQKNLEASVPILILE